MRAEATPEDLRAHRMHSKISDKQKKVNDRFQKANMRINAKLAKVEERAPMGNGWGEWRCSCCGFNITRP